MSDQIKECVSTKNENNDCIQYDVAYAIEDPNDATHVNSFCVSIKAEDMTDPTSATEAVSLANVRAAAIKTAWLAQEILTVHPEVSVIGDVAL